MDAATDNQENLRRILRKGYETKDFDYKGPVQWDASDKKDRCELVKDILAMANTLGGHIVIGVSEVPNGWNWEGVSDAQSKTFDSTKINAFVQTYSDPPINTRVHKVQDAGKNYVIIEVPRFPDTPHICQKAFPDVLADRALYVRTDNNESAPVRSSADFRIIIGRAVQNKSDELLQSIRSVIKGSVGTSATTSPDEFGKQIAGCREIFVKRNPLPNEEFHFFLETAFIPANFVARRFDVSRLRKTLIDASVDFIGKPFLFTDMNQPNLLNVFEDGLESLWYTDDLFGGKVLDFWRLYQSGLFYKKELPWQALQQPNVAIYPDVAQYFGIAVDCLARLYEPLLDPIEAITFRATMTGTKGRRMVNGSQGLPFFADYTSQIPMIQVEQTHSLAEWKAGILDFAAEMMIEIQTRFNWIPQNDSGTKGIISRTLSRTR
jgi:hypothetical protein